MTRYRYDPEGYLIEKSEPGERAWMFDIAGEVVWSAQIDDPLTETDNCGLAPWVFDPSKDVDMTGGRGTFKDAVDEAFRRTGLPREEFEVTRWENNIYGKTAPAEWTHATGALTCRLLSNQRRGRSS